VGVADQGEEVGRQISRFRHFEIERLEAVEPAPGERVVAPEVDIDVVFDDRRAHRIKARPVGADVLVHDRRDAPHVRHAERMPQLVSQDESEIVSGPAGDDEAGSRRVGVAELHEMPRLGEFVAAGEADDDIRVSRLDVLRHLVVKRREIVITRPGGPSDHPPHGEADPEVVREDASCDGQSLAGAGFPLGFRPELFVGGDHDRDAPIRACAGRRGEG
jgi:hypothetical protein